MINTIEINTKMVYTINITLASMSPASLGGGFHIVINRRYNLLLMTALLCNALATLNDGASPLLNKRSVFLFLGDGKHSGFRDENKNEVKTKIIFGGVDMSKGAKFLMVISIIIGVFAVAEILSEIFSTRMNRYYKVDSE